MVAAAGLFMGGVAMPSAKAADLGGDCCADLEERVAELEATTARKGNRRVSLTVTGQVSRDIMYWNDGGDSDVYAGVDNHNVSTRFWFTGSARISPNVTAGYEFMTEWSGGARTSTVSQIDEDGGVSGDGTLNVRTANWYLEDKNLGKLTVGRLNTGGPVGIIDLGGIGTAAHFAPTLVGGGFFLRSGTSGLLTPFKFTDVVGPVYGGGRMEGVRYDSPNIGGFVLQGAWGEDENWSASIRYAGEFGGIRVAAGIGYESIEETAPPSATDPFVEGTLTDEQRWAGGVSVMHVASGLFAQGYYGTTEFVGTTDPDGSIWMVQGGITKNWTGMGNTSVYGEYGRAKDYGIGKTVTVAGTPPGFVVAGDYTILDSKVTIFGVGLVQQVDAAAMELFLSWRRFDPEGSAEFDDGGAPVVLSPKLEAFDVIRGGARIRF